MFTPDRRRFLAATSAGFAGLLAASCRGPGGLASAGEATGYLMPGTLVPDPAGVLDLPPGYSYRVISRLGDAMADGGNGRRSARDPRSGCHWLLLPGEGAPRHSL